MPLCFGILFGERSKWGSHGGVAALRKAENEHAYAIGGA